MRSKKLAVFVPDDNTGPPPVPAAASAIPPRPQNPHRSPLSQPRASSSPRFPPYETFGRRPRAQLQRACKGPASETLQYSIADLADHGLGRPIGSGSGPRGRREVRPWPYLPTALNPLRAVLIGPGAGEKTGEAGFRTGRCPLRNKKRPPKGGFSVRFDNERLRDRDCSATRV
jgi:hypothetical protein